MTLSGKKGGVEKNTGGVSFADAEEEGSLQDESKNRDLLDTEKEEEGHQCWNFDWRSTPFHAEEF